MTTLGIINLYEKRDYETRVCANPKCGEAFLSQNPLQRYCDLMCGSRARANAAYHRRMARARNERTAA